MKSRNVSYEIEHVRSIYYRIIVVKTYRKYLLFGPTVESRSSFHGGGTVWHDEATGNRCTAKQEGYLSSIYTREVVMRQGRLEGTVSICTLSLKTK